MFTLKHSLFTPLQVSFSPSSCGPILQAIIGSSGRLIASTHFGQIRYSSSLPINWNIPHDVRKKAPPAFPSTPGRLIYYIIVAASQNQRAIITIKTKTSTSYINTLGHTRRIAVYDFDKRKHSEDRSKG
jgi:hypothetical protein